jgi:serine phosphatase RsbU (regulator of sigma subunit)
MEDAEFVPVHGRMLHGDVMLLYTDGVVETRSQDFVLGIDKLIGQAERLMSEGWVDSAERLLERLDEPGDDRAIFFVHRH